ncbi:ammonium transporter [Dehalogenimonas sp. 4OHTPN]|uniref:Ammonium transporter n=1 Tax=Dehalogenimonas sp. 4OHTPN TaxID=3166643 RepID=A0AAU8GBA7_9CHLR
MNSGDTAWILVSTALVMLMTPGVALFYGGMVRKKNLISTLMMSFAVLALVSILWVVFGYTLAFGPDIAGFVGGLDFLGLKDVGMEATSYSIPDLLYMMFQGVFAVITVALITGAVVERIKFSTLMVFAVAWLALIYGPVAHWVWGGGWLAQLGALDFAGGTVVHINAGVSAAALVVLLGARKGLGREPMEPNNIPMVMLGAALLWFGWFGFNAGSSLGANGGAANAFVTTNTAAAAAALVWILLSWRTRKPTLLGAVTGAVAGLVAITPAAGFVSPMAAIAIGAVAAAVCYFAMNFKAKIGFDDSLDVMSVHGVGGIWGALATGIFANAAIGGVDGALAGNLGQLWNQIIAVGAVMAYSFIGTLAIGKILDKTMGLRVKELEEVVGLDLSQHGERAYGGIK